MKLLLSPPSSSSSSGVVVRALFLGWFCWCDVPLSFFGVGGAASLLRLPLEWVLLGGAAVPPRCFGWSSLSLAWCWFPPLLGGAVVLLSLLVGGAFHILRVVLLSQPSWWWYLCAALSSSSGVVLLSLLLLLLGGAAFSLSVCGTSFHICVCFSVIVIIVIITTTTENEDENSNTLERSEKGPGASTNRREEKAAPPNRCNQLHTKEGCESSHTQKEGGESSAI